MKRTVYATRMNEAVVATPAPPVAAPPTTMRAAVQHRYGIDAIDVRELPVPTPGPGEVRVRIGGAGINPADWYLAEGTPFLVRLTDGLTRPKQRTPGRDACGVIDAVGDDVVGFAVGDRVFGSVRGAFAEYAIADPDRLAMAPAAMTCAEASALPIAGVTALEAVERAEVEGRTVVVNGASGGVGHLAVQIARACGAREVIGVCSGRNVDFVRSLGADRVVDYEVDDFTDEPFDVLIDCVATQPTRKVLRALRRDGAWVLVGVARRVPLLGPLPGLVGAVVRSRLAGRGCIPFVADETTERLTRLAELVDAGQVRVHIAGERPLYDVADAYDRVESQRIAGKVVVVP